MTFSGRRASQHPDELAEFIALMQCEGVRSYLEIGARHGDTFHEVALNLHTPSVMAAVDLPGGNWGVRTSQSHLDRAAESCRDMGHNIALMLGDSRSKDVISMVEGYGPFDAALIDGDHLYDGVKADWLNYGPMAHIVAFHDIAGDGVLQKSSKLPVEVPRLWNEIKGGFRHVEIVAPGSTMGIGVIWR
ncbi:class I SAM-dependent methyltransferase [Bosea minatitlanensis]|uniref:Class I SAM-dependent methyltransferase n=1 Tax=Bosea minatitlanensis TaxID=128782 RepID=A0ABW0F4B1_9HYPH|nr:class I SAM-dependent methyltransferase [Bosea minatitlanensis]MCT4492708.1 class I SAM-dependent methyltransferase [Bosea minatitlanensis]